MTNARNRGPQFDVTLDLDADIIYWFKSRAEGGKGYQTAINATLRKVVEKAMGR